MININKTRGIDFLVDVNITKLANKIKSTSEDVWADKNKIKPNKFGVLVNTQHIVFRFIDDFNDHRTYSNLDVWGEWKELIQPILKAVAKYYGYEKAEFPRIMLAKLPAGGKVKPHIDKSPAAQYPHKIHVPLQTNEQTLFCLEGQCVNMKVGHAYEVNNNRLHWVENNGETERIHLIFECFQN